MTERVLITGASGFVGGALLARIAGAPHTAHWTARAAVRVAGRTLPLAGEQRVVGNIDRDTDWNEALEGVSAVVHLAARVHVMRERREDVRTLYNSTNVAGTENLARSAARCGVRRFVFLSSVKVNGESTAPGYAFTEAVPSAAVPPTDPYAASKREAEDVLRRVGADTGMEIVIVRPPLVYGPGVRANFAALLRLVKSGAPLPFGAIQNRRSLVGVSNLADFIVHCIANPDAANETFLVSDGEDLSTPDLVRRMARALGRPARLFPVPPGLLQTVADTVGAGNAMHRLLDSLVVDCRKARQLLGWIAPLTIDEELARTTLVSVPAPPSVLGGAVP